MKKTGFKIQLLFAGFLLLSGFANAQTNYKDAFVVFSNGDTLRGQIDYKNWESNPRKIRFKDVSSSTTIYTTKDLNSFTITGLDKYQRAIIDKDIRPVDIHGLLTAGDSDVSVTDTVFLRLITSGKVVTLYELLENKVHYYIQEGAGRPEELIYKTYLVNDNSALEEKPHFRNQLTRLSLNTNNSSLADKIENTRYNEKDLRYVIRIINGEDSKTVKTSEEKKKNPLDVMAGAGIENYSPDANNHESRIAPIINAAVDVFPARNRQKIAVRLQLSYLPIKYETTYDLSSNMVKNFSQSNLLPEMNLIFHFINRSSLKIYAGFGIGVNVTLQTNNSYYYKTPPAGGPQNRSYTSGLEAHTYSSFLLGAKIIKKINLGVATKIGSGTEDTLGFNGKFLPVSFTASYIIFSRKNGKS